MADEPQEINHGLEPGTVDLVLQELVRIFNSGDSDEGSGITLSVGGILVSGYLIGGAKYIEHFISHVSGEGTQDTERTQKVAGYLEPLREFYRPPQDHSEVDPAWQYPVYIHLKNARFFHPGGPAIPTNKPIWWRGRLSSVDGFSFGVLSAAPE